jgi:hypothetical protein
MSERIPISRAAFLDTVGLRVQELRASGQLAGDQPLLRIDNRERAKDAPFQFDAARGRLHRAGCRAIPAGSASALYGLWEIKTEDPSLGCPRCNPMDKPVAAEAESWRPTEAPRKPANAPDAQPEAAKPEAKAKPEARPEPGAGVERARPQDDQTVDLLYGFLSIVTQFGGVLRERGQEYRRSRAGAAVGARFEKIYAEVNDGERRVLDVLTSSLDTLAVALRELEAGVTAERRPDETQ